MKTIKPRGPVPSLIGGSNGRPKRIQVKRVSKCARCETELLAGTFCIEIPQLAKAYKAPKRICLSCFKNILDKTEQDINELKAYLPTLASSPQE